MAGRWGDPSAFRADPAATPAARPTHRQTVALLTVLVLVAGAVAIASYLVRPERARAFALFHGSMFLADQQSPVAVDLASGKPTLRLVGADKQVGAAGGNRLGVVPLEGRTLLLNRSTGEFNMVDTSGFVVKNDGGVPLGGAIPKGTTAMGVADGELAYVVRSNSAGTDVYLVSQATVESAMGASGAVKPRASTTMPGAPTTTAAGSAVAADGALWLLVRTSNRQTVRRLTVPAGSSSGAALRITDRGTVSGSAALATATLSSGGSGTSVVGLASADRIRIYSKDASTRTVPFQAVPGLDQVLPATNAAGRLAFLLHGSNGWSIVSVAADGSDVRGPNLVRGIGREAELVQPAASGGLLYTIDKGSSTGVIYQIDDRGRAKPVPGAASYPVVENVESSTFADAYVIARGPRVVVNSPAHIDAVMVFTDGSHGPRTIQKSSAVAVSATNGAEQLTRSTVSGPQPGQAPKPGGATPKPAPGQAINNKVDCKTAAQKPHIPTIDRATPGSRSVLLHWTYPILDPTQDCFPSTYVLNVTKLSGDAPTPPSSVRIQGQDGANLTGLFPLTSYQITVTAYIHGEGTASAPRDIRTGPEGPAAPTNLSVSADSSGNWHLSWQACGTVAQGCVAAQSWTVTPSYCDGRGLGEPPAPMTVTADPTSKAQPPAVYKGSDALLGRGLSFTVTGQGESQVPGTPSARTACTYSWSNPAAADIKLAASTPPQAASASDTTTTTASVSFTSSAVHALGGAGGTLIYKLLSNGTVVDTVGPTESTTVTLHGIRAARHYQVTVQATPPRHPSAAVVVGPVDVQQATAAWPSPITVSATSVNDDGPFNANVTMQLSGPASASADGEHFDVSWVLDCGNRETAEMSRQGIDPADAITFSVSRVDGYYGSCSIKVHRLAESGASGVFGGTPAPDIPRSAAFTVDQPTLTGVSSSDFSAAWDGSDGSTPPLSQVKVTYSGGNPVIGLLSTWSVAVSDPSGASCGGYTDDNNLHDVTVAQSCVDEFGSSGDGWHVAVTVKSIGGQTQSATVNRIGGGAAPTWHPPCVVSASNFAGTWSGTTTSPAIQLSYTQGSDQLGGCTGWSYSVGMPAGVQCSQPPAQSGTPPTSGPYDFAVTCTATPDWQGWSVTVSYNDANGSHNQSVPVTGTPAPG